MSWPVWVVIGYFVLLYGLVPIVLRYTIRQAASPRFEPLPEHDHDALSSREFFQRTTEALIPIGFSFVVLACQDQEISGVTAYVSMLRKNPEQDWGMLTHLVAQSQSSRKDVSYVEFSTSFTDGSSINTNNSPELPGRDTDASKHQFQLPHVGDAPRLYTIHRALVSRFATGAAPREIPDDRVLSVLGDEVQRDFQTQEARGWFYLDPSERVYRPTLVGAYRMAWRQLWPVITIRRIACAVRARRIDRSVPS